MNLAFSCTTPDWGQQYLTFKSDIIDAIEETKPSGELKIAVDKIVKTLDNFPFSFLNAENLNDSDQFKTLISKLIRKKNMSNVEPHLLKIFNDLIALDEKDLAVLETTLVPISQTWAKYISIIKSEKRENQLATGKEQVIDLQAQIRRHNIQHTVFFPSKLLPLLNVPLLNEYTAEEKASLAKALCIEINDLLSDLGNNGKSTRIEKNTKKHLHVVSTTENPVCDLFHALNLEIKQATADPQKYCAELTQDILKTQPFTHFKNMGIDVPKFLCLEMLQIINKVSLRDKELYHIGGGESRLSTGYNSDILKAKKFYKLDQIHSDYSSNFTYRYILSRNKQFITLVVEEPIYEESQSSSDESQSSSDESQSKEDLSDEKERHSFIFHINELKPLLIFKEKKWGKTDRLVIDKIIHPAEKTLETYQKGKFTEYYDHKVMICPNLDYWIEFNEDRSFVTLTLIDNEIAGKGTCRINFGASSINIPVFTDAKANYKPMLITRVHDPKNEHHVRNIKNGASNLDFILKIAAEKKNNFVKPSRNRLPDVAGKNITRQLPLEMIRKWYPGTLYDVVKRNPLKIGSEFKPLPYNIHRLLTFYLEVAEAMIPLHAKGIVHCDIKPENILIKTDGVKASACLNDVDLATCFGTWIAVEYPYWDRTTIMGYITPFSDCYALAVSMLEIIFITGNDLVEIFKAEQVSKKTFMQKAMKRVVQNSMLDDHQKDCLVAYFSKNFNFSSKEIDNFIEKFDPENFEEKNLKEIKKVISTIKVYSEVFDLVHKIFLSSLKFDEFKDSNEDFRKIWNQGTIKQKLAEIERIQGDYLFMPQIAKELKRIFAML